MALGEREEGEESAAADPAPAPSTTAESEAPLGSLLSTRAHAESHLVTERAIAGPRCASSSLIGKEREKKGTTEASAPSGTKKKLSRPQPSPLLLLLLLPLASSPRSL